MTTPLRSKGFAYIGKKLQFSLKGKCKRRLEAVVRSAADYFHQNAEKYSDWIDSRWPAISSDCEAL